MSHLVDTIIILAVIGATAALGHTAYLVLEFIGR